jgi:hypothetical protein
VRPILILAALLGMAMAAPMAVAQPAGPPGYHPGFHHPPPVHHRRWRWRNHHREYY